MISPSEVQVGDTLCGTDGVEIASVTRITRKRKVYVYGTEAGGIQFFNMVCPSNTLMPVLR